MDGSRVNNGRWEVVATFLHEARHRGSRCWFVRLHEASVVHAHKGISASSIGEVVNAECIRLYLRAADSVRVVPLKLIGEGNAIHGARLKHFI